MKYINPWKPTEEQQQLIVDMAMSDPKKFDAIVAAMGHHYAMGWQDYLLPFVGVGLVLGILVGRKIPF